MSWTFSEVSSALITQGLHPTDSTQCTFGKVKISPQVSITADVLERNVAAYYIYGPNQNDATLLELTLAKSNQEFLAEAETRFEKIVRNLFTSTTKQQLPHDFALTSNNEFESEGFILKCHENSEVEPHTIKVLIAQINELSDGMNIRQQFLYPLS